MADLDVDGALVAAGRLRRCADRAEADLLALAAHYADLHAVLPGQPAAGHPSRLRVGGAEKLIPLAGPGTPQVAEFAPVELGAVLAMTSYAAANLIGDALELRHRLPRLWARVMAGDLPAWRARRIAEHTTTLSREAAAWVDGQVAPFAHKLGRERVQRLLEQALIRFDPDAAAAKAAKAAEHRGVFVSDEMTDGTRSIRIDTDALDAAAFDATITALAAALAALGDTNTLDVRRAKAVGVIADPQGALDLLHPDQTDPGQADGAQAGDQASPTAGNGVESRTPGAPGKPGRCATCGKHQGRRTGKPKVVLYLHLHQDAIAATPPAAGKDGGPGVVGRVEGLGPATVEQIRDWVGRADLTIKPVLDLADRTSVDAYEVPDRMGETVYLRNSCCPFPWCNNLTRNKDSDHNPAYIPREAGGPPAQTSPDKLTGLCRRHHRVRTHGGWTYQMPQPGLYLWTSPHGRHYLVDHTGTTNLPHTA